MALQLQCEDCNQYFIMGDLGDVSSACPYCGGNGVYEDPVSYSSKPAKEPQIGDHPGDKRARNRAIRRTWTGQKKIVPTNKYNGYD